MSADSFDNLPYRPVGEVIDEAARRHYWACAIGLQDVDGLEVSDYAREVAAGYIKGEHSLDEAGDYGLALADDDLSPTLALIKESR